MGRNLWKIAHWNWDNAVSFVLLQLASGLSLNPFTIISDVSNALKDSATGFVSGATNVTQAVVGTAAQVADPWLQIVNTVIQAKIAAESQFLSLLNSLGK